MNRDGKVLMAKRPIDKVLPGQWELPGGKVDLGESEHAALKREVQEELDLRVSVGRLISTAAFTWDARVHMLLYECVALIPHRTAKPLASTRLDWCDPAYMSRHYPCCPSLFSWFTDIQDHLDSNEGLCSDVTIDNSMRES